VANVSAPTYISAIEGGLAMTSYLWFAAAAGLAMAVAPAQAQAFSISFSWAGIPACERISPAFALASVPAGTKRLRFEMHDLDVPGFHHGGSTVAYQGDAVKQGAIHYIGPCPPHGERHRYRWTVEALNDKGKVLGKTTATATFPP
jgi:phosphatidylethanolamine-binding protein (PEBP) family uncharacterized protein